MALRASGLLHVDSSLNESEAATHSILRLCSFQEFFKKAGDVSEAAGEPHSASQQEPAVIVLLPLLLGLGKVRLEYNAKHCACRVQWSISMCCHVKADCYLSINFSHPYTRQHVSPRHLCTESLASAAKALLPASMNVLVHTKTPPRMSTV